MVGAVGGLLVMWSVISALHFYWSVVDFYFQEWSVSWCLNPGGVFSTRLGVFLPITLEVIKVHSRNFS